MTAPMAPPPVTGPPPPRRATVTIAATLAGLAAVLVLVVLVLVDADATPGAAPAPTSDADPYVRDFANDLSGEVHQPLAVPETFSYGPTVDGCDHAYGVRGECVPYNFPPGVANTPSAKCAWLAAHQFRALEVPGVDRHGLVPAGGRRAASGNPYACPNELR
ncbi:MAG: hypothetical protein ACRDTF_23435 [Pseudonocardiaceae bacterium]